MNQIMSKLVVLAIIVTTAGCASDHASTPEASSAPQAAKEAGGKACVLKVGERGLLRVTVSNNTVCTPKDGWLILKSADNDFVHVWFVDGARSVDDAVARVDQVIAPEFKKFKANTTTAVTVASAPAKRLSGAGVEADDGDPGTADVVVFKLGDHVFVACTHGERLSPAAQQWMMTIVQTAHAP